MAEGVIPHTALSIGECSSHDRMLDSRFKREVFPLDMNNGSLANVQVRARQQLTVQGTQLKTGNFHDDSIMGMVDSFYSLASNTYFLSDSFHYYHLGTSQLHNGFNLRY